MLRTAVLTAGLGGALAAISADQVTSLPGWNAPLLSSMYSGYLSIPGGKRLHYVFVESQGNPSSDPVVLWLNGGPGCSSMEGMFYENGPYGFVPGAQPAQLVANNYTWNAAANMLYLEAPAGVGFSYAYSASGLVQNDSSTAADNLAALQAFFSGFPEYAGSDFYISGESYAGVYIPTLAFAVWQANAQGASPAIALKGLLVGNGCIGNAAGVCGSDPLAPWYNIEQWRGHGLVSWPTYSAILSQCAWSAPSPACKALLTQARAEVNAINVYDIYGPCINSGTSSPALLGALQAHGLSKAQRREYLARSAARSVKRPLADWELAALSAEASAAAAAAPSAATAEEEESELPGVSGPITCIDAGDATPYLNSAAVRAALHVDATLPWAICTGNASWVYTPSEPDVRKTIYPTLLAGGVRVLIYNGEADACVPWTDNEAWTRSMNYTTVKPWSAWMSDAEDVGGYVTRYGPVDFTFTTVRGAGHMVPQTQPLAAWVMFNTFINKLPWQ